MWFSKEGQGVREYLNCPFSRMLLSIDCGVNVFSITIKNYRNMYMHTCTQVCLALSCKWDSVVGIKHFPYHKHCLSIRWDFRLWLCCSSVARNPIESINQWCHCRERWLYRYYALNKYGKSTIYLRMWVVAFLMFSFQYIIFIVTWRRWMRHWLRNWPRSFPVNIQQWRDVVKSLIHLADS